MSAVRGWQLHGGRATGNGDWWIVEDDRGRAAISWHGKTSQPPQRTQRGVTVRRCLGLTTQQLGLSEHDEIPSYRCIHCAPSALREARRGRCFCYARSCSERHRRRCLRPSNFNDALYGKPCFHDASLDDDRWPMVAPSVQVSDGMPIFVTISRDLPRLICPSSRRGWSTTLTGYATWITGSASTISLLVLRTPRPTFDGNTGTRRAGMRPTGRLLRRPLLFSGQFDNCYYDNTAILLRERGPRMQCEGGARNPVFPW